MSATSGRSGGEDAEAILQAQLNSAKSIVNAFAEGSKAYWLMWGVLGRPVEELAQMTAEVQRRYLEELENTLY